MNQKFIAFVPSLSRKLSRICLGMLLPILLLLTGCVRYDVGLNFQHQHQGAIVQQISLGEQLSSFSRLEAEKWLASIGERAKKLQGKIQTVSPEEVVVTIPFNNGQELATKFKQFFNPTEQKASQLAQFDALDLVQLQSDISLNQSNWLLLERNKLHLTVDLRPLGVLSDGGNVIIGPGELLDLQFHFNAPWGVTKENGVEAEVSKKGNELIWKLESGKINDIEVVFWLPSYLGIGAIVIIVLMVLGFYVKYKYLPGIPQPVIDS